MSRPLPAASPPLCEHGYSSEDPSRCFELATFSLVMVPQPEKWPRMHGPYLFCTAHAQDRYVRDNWHTWRWVIEPIEAAT